MGHRFDPYKPHHRINDLAGVAVVILTTRHVLILTNSPFPFSILVAYVPQSGVGSRYPWRIEVVQPYSAPSVCPPCRKLVKVKSSGKLAARHIRLAAGRSKARLASPPAILPMQLRKTFLCCRQSKFCPPDQPRTI